MQGHWRGHPHAPQMHPVHQTVDLMLQCAAREVQTRLNHRRPSVKRLVYTLLCVGKPGLGAFWQSCIGPSVLNKLVITRLSNIFVDITALQAL